MNSDLLLEKDTGDSIQGHVGPNTPQVFETLRAVPFKQPRLKLDGFEFILRDQFGNYYHKMRAVLFDGEMYDVDQFIKPSMMTKHGGGWAHFEDKWAKQHLRITEGLLSELRERGAETLARTNLLILQGRQQSTNPVAIETHDITHQANVLEDKLADAVKEAKVAAGETVPEGAVTPDGFVPIKPDPTDLALNNVLTFPLPEPSKGA
jgi:hypothetical protein